MQLFERILTFFFMIISATLVFIFSKSLQSNTHFSLQSLFKEIIRIIVSILRNKRAFNLFLGTLPLFLFLVTVSNLHQAHAADWIQVINNDGDDSGNDIKIDSGYLYIAGINAADAASANLDYVVYKLNPDGSQAWKATGGLTNIDKSNSVVLKDTNIIAFGSSNAGVSKSRLWVIDNTGTEIDTHEYSADIGIEGIKITLRSTGDFIIVGKSSTTGTVGIVNNGLNINKKKAPIETIDIRGSAEVPTGKTAIIGNSNSGECVYILYDISLNILVGAINIKYTPGSFTYCYDIALLTDSNLIITGYANPGDNGANEDAFLAKIDLNGNEIWKKAIGYGGDDEARVVKEMPDGSLALAGFTFDLGLNGKQAWVFIADNTGNILQEKIYGLLGDDVFNSLAIDSGKITAVGTQYTGGTNGFDILIVSPDFCKLGQYFDAISLTNKNCLAGTYQDECGKSSCKPCDPGKYQDLEGQASCKPCHKLCLTCHGGTNLDCYSCQIGVTNLDPNSDGNSCFCMDGYFYDASKTNVADLCQPCAKYCKHCSGSPSYCTECDASAGITFNHNTCLCNGLGYFEYLNPATLRYECVQCHTLCDQCTGPLQTQCSACSTKHNAVFDGISTCNCQDGYYFDSNIQDCMPCNSLCLKCTGPSNTDCDGCNVPTGIPVTGISNFCVSDCDFQPGYYKNSLGMCARIFHLIYYYLIKSAIQFVHHAIQAGVTIA